MHIYRYKPTISAKMAKTDKEKGRRDCQEQKFDEKGLRAFFQEKES